MKKKYVLGFMFSEDKSEITLIEKNRPEAQKGLLNGIGGHVEEGESFITAMKREFVEETGYNYDSWTFFTVLKQHNFVIRCYVGKCDLTKLSTKTDEELVTIKLDNLLKSSLVEHTNWLVVKALNYLE